jgi:hypothetical protein
MIEEPIPLAEHRTNVISKSKQSRGLLVALLVGGVGGGTIFFLIQFVAQIPCQRIVVTGPSCPAFSVSIPALILGAVVGITMVFSVRRLFLRGRRNRSADGAQP